MSTLRTGDTVFTPAGSPAVVMKQNPVGNQTTLDRSKESLQSTTRHGYINGLSQVEREEFNNIMDGVKELDDPGERVEELQAKIAELKLEPKKNFILSKYLTSELSHVLFEKNVEPKIFTMSESKLKTSR